MSSDGEDEDETILGAHAADLGLCPACGSLSPGRCGCTEDEVDAAIEEDERS